MNTLRLAVFIHSPNLSNLPHFEFGQRLDVSESVSIVGVITLKDEKNTSRGYKNTEAAKKTSEK